MSDKIIGKVNEVVDVVNIQTDVIKDLEREKININTNEINQLKLSVADIQQNGCDNPPPGPIGPEGPQGPQGIQGPQGEQGIQGIKGNDGDSIHIKGSVPTYNDLVGITPVEIGDVYVTTDTGHLYYYDGTQFVDLGGIKGDEGQQGPQGVKGDTGAQGIQGIQGIQGVKGDNSFPYRGVIGGNWDHLLSGTWLAESNNGINAPFPGCSGGLVIFSFTRIIFQIFSGIDMTTNKTTMWFRIKDMNWGDWVKVVTE